MKKRLAAWAVPAAACLLLYGAALTTWFFMDDFAWLGLRLSIGSPADLFSALFEPRAQGTTRFLSERVFFLGMEWLFGLQALPFRIVVFATHLLSLWLLIRLMERMTGSWLAGSLAALFWVGNAALAKAFSWTCVYNQILWPCLMLAALHQRWRWLESGGKQARVLEWIFFLLGFGALELQVVYPVLAAVMTRLYVPARWRSVLPMFGIAAFYGVLNRWLVRADPGASYRMYFDLDIASTFGTYLRMLIGIWRPDRVEQWPWAEALVVLGVLGAILFLAYKREKVAVLAAAIMLTPLLPLLPLKNHITDYYLAVPAMGLAMACGWAASKKPLWAAVPALAFFAGSGSLALEIVEFNHRLGDKAERLVRGVEAAARLHPGKMILLAAVSSEQYWSAINDDAFRLLPGVRVFLAPGAEDTIDPHPELGDPKRFAIPGPVALAALEKGGAVVYSAAGPRLTNETAVWMRMAPFVWKNKLATVVRIGEAAFQQQLVEGWYESQGHFRWMAGHATIRLGAPGSATEVFLEALRPESAAELRLAVNGVDAGQWSLPTGMLSIRAPLPASVKRSEPLLLEWRVTPVIVESGSGRPLGLAVGTVGLR